MGKRTIQSSNYINSHLVRVKDDFPTPVSGSITLLNDMRYVINGTIDLNDDNLILQNNTNIVGADLASTITYDGSSSLVNSTDVDFNINYINFYLSNDSGSLFDIDNTDKTKNAIMYKLFVSGGKIGEVDGYHIFNIENSMFKYLKCGITFYSAKNIILSSVYFSDTSECDFVTFDTGDFHSVMIDTCTFHIPDNKSGITALNNPNVTYGMITSNMFELGSGSLGLDGISSPLNPEWHIEGNSNCSQNRSVLPVVNDAKMNSIITPPSGAHIYNTDINSFVVYDGTRFVSVAMTTVYTNLFTETFASGNFTANSWTVVNNGVNDWYVGTAVHNIGSYSAYISNNSGTNAQYTINNAEVSHFYKDFTMSQAYDDLQLSFDWKCEGEVGYDYGRVFLTPTSVTPTAGNQVNTSYSIGKNAYNNQSTWTSEGISLGSRTNGEVIRIIFSWRNDGSVGTNPAFCVDNIKLNYI